MAAFRRAIEMGARFIETDLHISRDAQLVVIHDATLERTTNGRGAVKDFTLAELQGLDAGAWYGPQFAGERIPTLDALMQFAREADINLFLEIKQDAAWGIEHGLVSTLRASGEGRRVVILSFSPGILRNIQRLDRTLMTCLLTERLPASPEALIRQAQDVAARQIGPRGDLITPELIEAAHRQDIHVIAWTVNQPEHMRLLADAGVDGIMTDYPDRLVTALQAKA